MPGVSPTATASFFDAVKAGRRESVREMLAREPALARVRDENGVSALLLALYHREPEIASLVATRAGALDVREAAALGDADRVRALAGADRSLADAPGGDGFTPLGLAAFFKRVDAVRALLAAGADPSLASRNGSRFTPLHSAVSTDAGPLDMAIVRAIVEAGAD